MIAVDANVLLRYLLQDDAIQSPKANLLFDDDGKILLTDIVLAEATWTLMGKKYKASRDQIVEVVDSLFQEANIEFENSQVIWSALSEFRKASSVKVGKKRKYTDFADALIIEKARATCIRKQIRFESVYTFDVAAQQIYGTKEP